MELFLDKYVPTFEKIAAEVELPEDPNRWPYELLQELHKQVSFISDFDPRIVMDRVDAEKGYGFGHFEVGNRMSDPNATPEAKSLTGARSARIPIIISDGRLKPFDLIINESAKIYPLTESRVRQALFRPNMFDLESKSPGGTSIVGRLYPPMRQSSTLDREGMTVQSSAGMGKTGHVKTAEEQFNDFVTEGETKQPGFTAWDGQQLQTAGAAEQRQRVRAEGDLQKAIDLGEGAWGQVLSDQNRQAMGMPTRGPIKGTNGPDTYSKRQAVLHSIAGGGRTKHASKMMKLKIPEAEKIIEGQKASASRPQYTGTMGADGKIKTAAGAPILNTILPTINESDFLRFAQACEPEEVKIATLKNTPMAEAMGKLANWVPQPKIDVGSMARQDVCQVSKLDDGTYRMKYASSKYWDPRTTIMDRGSLYDAVGDVATQVDLHGSVTMVKKTAGLVESNGPEADNPEPIEDFGMYKVQTAEGQSVIGFAIPNLIDLDGTVLPLVLFTNGSASAVQGDMVGVRSGGEPNLPDGLEQGHGCFVRTTESGKAEATTPLEIKAQMSDAQGQSWVAEDFQGRPVTVRKQPNIKMPMKVDDEVLLPESYRWMPLGGESLVIVDRAEPFGKQAEAVRHMLSVEIRGGSGSFSIDGPPVDKIAAAERHAVGYDDAVFLLGGLGVSPKFAIQKLSMANYASYPVSVRIGRTIKTAEMRKSAALQAARIPSNQLGLYHLPHLVKEASVIPDPTAVDAVLSLGFLNPENILSFIDALPNIENAQSRLCEMLLGSRLGMKEIPEGALEKAIRATEDVLEGLKVLAFQET